MFDPEKTRRLGDTDVSDANVQRISDAVPCPAVATLAADVTAGSLLSVSQAPIK